MVNDRGNWPLEQDMIEALGDMPEAEVPEGFAASVMEGLEPRRPGLWLRLRLWLTEPRSFTMTRLGAASACAALLLTFALGMQFGERAADSSGMIAEQGVPVRFVLSDAAVQARTVAVVGSFNGWKGEGTVMRYDRSLGQWVLEAQLPPGDHEYMFLVDGRRLVTDPQAQMTRDDGFGNLNSVVFVSGSDAMSL